MRGWIDNNKRQKYKRFSCPLILFVAFVDFSSNDFSLKHFKRPFKNQSSIPLSIL